MKIKFFLPLLALAMSMTSCTSSNSMQTATASDATPSVAATSNSSNDAYYAVLEFDKGTQRLNEESKKNLREFVAAAKREGRPIDDIRILAWADKEYPAKGGKLSKQDIKMANGRTKSIERYLKEDLNTDGDYATYNMAKRPNKVNEFFRGDDYKTKKIFEQPGSAPAGTQMSSFMNNKSSKALIMVDYSEVE